MTAPKVIQFGGIKIERNKRYNLLVELISTIMKDNYLTPKEIKVVAKICELDKRTLTTENRKTIAEELGISIFDLNNYIKTLRKKYILKENTLNETIFGNVQLEGNDQIVVVIGIKLL